MYSHGDEYINASAAMQMIEAWQDREEKHPWESHPEGPCRP